MLTPLGYQRALRQIGKKLSPNTSGELEKKHGLTPLSDWDMERCATNSFKWGESSKALTPTANWGKKPQC